MELDINETIGEIKNIFSQKTEKEKFSITKFKLLKPYFKKNSLIVSICLIFTLISSVIILPAPILYKIIIDDFIPTKNMKMIFILGAVLLIIYILNLLSKVFMEYFFAKLNNKLLLTIKEDFFAKIISLPLSFFSDKQSSYLIARISEIDQIGSIFSFTFSSLLVSLLAFVFSVSILLFLSWKIFLITVFFIPLQYFFIRRFSGSIKNISNIKLEKSAILNKNMQEVFAGIQTVKSFSAENKEKLKIHSSTLSVFKSSFLQSVLFGISNNLIGLINHFGRLSVLIASAFLIIKGQFTVGLYVAAFQYVNVIFTHIQLFASSGLVLQPVIVAINRINEYDQLICENSLNERTLGIKEPIGQIEFRNVSFSYKDDKELLKDINFKINNGEKIAIVGPNGAGKSTLFKLLLQLHYPQQGGIFIDDVNLNRVQLTDIRKRIGLVTQEVFLFNDTIKNNLLYGCTEYSEKEFEYFINRFCSFIYDLPNGLNTIIGERGLLLSGGQKQALSIVRTLLKHPDIFIFDEGTANLDKMAYKDIIKLIKEYFVNNTCIFISHQDAIIETANRVFEIKNKTIVEEEKNEVKVSV